MTIKPNELSLKKLLDLREHPYEKALEQVMLKLKTLVKNRYNTDLSYTHLTSNISSEFKIVQDRLLENQPITLDKKIFFPVIAKGRLLGAAEISPVKHLNATDVDNIFDLVGLVLETTVLTAMNLDGLEQLESHLKRLESEKNVVRLSEYRLTPKRDELDPNIFIPQRHRNNFNMPCLIHGQNHSDNFKLAMEIHGLSQRYAFVPIEDLNLSQYKVSEISELGPMTIYIEELAELSQEEENILMRYLRTVRSADCPQIIASTLLSHQQLIKSRLVNPDLVQALCVAQINLNEDFNYYKQRDLSQLFFSSLRLQTSPLFNPRI